MRFDQPFAGVGYGMGVGIVLDPARADFNEVRSLRAATTGAVCTAPGSGSIRPTTSSSSA